MSWTGRVVGDAGEDADAEPEPADVLDVGGLTVDPHGRARARRGLVWTLYPLLREGQPEPATAGVAVACAACVEERRNAGVLEGATNRPLAPGEELACQLCGEAIR